MGRDDISKSSVLVLVDVSGIVFAEIVDDSGKFVLEAKYVSEAVAAGLTEMRGAVVAGLVVSEVGVVGPGNVLEKTVSEADVVGTESVSGPAVSRTVVVLLADVTETVSVGLEDVSGNNVAETVDVSGTAVVGVSVRSG